MTERFEWKYHGHSPTTGLPIWSCRREGAGILGWGSTQNEAKADFDAKENELVPTHQEREVESAIDDQLHREAFGDNA